MLKDFFKNMRTCEKRTYGFSKRDKDARQSVFPKDALFISYLPVSTHRGDDISIVRNNSLVQEQHLVLQGAERLQGVGLHQKEPVQKNAWREHGTKGCASHMNGIGTLKDIPWQLDKVEGLEAMRREGV